MFLFHVGILVASFFMARWTIPLFLDLLNRAGLVRPNFRGESIPVAGGLVLIAVPLFWIVVSAFIELFFRESAELVWRQAALGLVLTAFGLAGLLDDTIGSREQTGLKGHLTSLFQRGTLTTGAFKALFGGAVAVGFAALTAHFGRTWNVGDLAVNALIVALSANTLNIFDLRPGRAGKVYLLFAAVIFLVGRVPETLALLFPVMGALLALLPFDLKAQVMMGDTGSNPLGASLGVFAVFALGLGGRLIYLLILAALHVLAEITSISALIERNWLLRAVDRLGRD